MEEGRRQARIWLRRLVFLVLALSAGLIYQAHAAEAPDFARAVDKAIEEVIRPGYAALHVAADDQRDAMAALCADPEPQTLAAARDRFRGLVVAFARVELYRFGPARTDNRFERLFFSPDRRGRGLRQVARLIAAADETALDVATLRGKSVAVQGLLALD